MRFHVEKVIAGTSVMCCFLCHFILPLETIEYSVKEYLAVESTVLSVPVVSDGIIILAAAECLARHTCLSCHLCSALFMDEHSELVIQLNIIPEQSLISSRCGFRFASPHAWNSLHHMFITAQRYASVVLATVAFFRHPPTRLPVYDTPVLYQND